VFAICDAVTSDGSADQTEARLALRIVLCLLFRISTSRAVITLRLPDVHFECRGEDKP